MREFEFVVRFDEGVDDLMDVFRAYPSLSARTSVCVCTEETMWRVDHLKGPAEGLEAVEEVFLDESRCNECLDAPDCETSRWYQVLDRQSNALTVYTRRREVSDCRSVPYIVVDHLGDGVLFEARRTGAEYRWKVLYPEDGPVGALYDAIEAELRPGLELEVSHLRTAGNWDVESSAGARLSHDHWEVLEAAYEAGYYERPREVTVTELAEELGVPRSTVQYRLRTAEDTVLSRFIERSL
ncbi:helix-turn-helix domain-containing protein [Candidatus Halobonum tyrrellensis]|uniref:Transcriptional regulator n=1 Tax=Candidatus Halobonum tyrrellensis G22 TaxID=1324957 RepID=V4HKN5_9EURY|nr:helix-turn-helix domain-containing protein [Candidatus Halobonum tyrrellensis]ESP88489.1 transcriptional regulator [Candidatus Halobonum tyrrellensis G22]